MVWESRYVYPDVFVWMLVIGVAEPTHFCGPNQSEAFEVLSLLHATALEAHVRRDCKVNKQTTGLGHVTQQDLIRLQLIFPSPEVASAFDKTVHPLFEMMQSQILQTC